MRKWLRITLAICIALSAMILLISGLSVRAQGETTIYDFSTGWQGWLWRDVGHPESVWQGEVSTWQDWYAGWLTWDDVGLDGPYTGVIMGGVSLGGAGKWAYASIYYPETISATMIRTYVHRSTQEFFTPWIHYWINHGSGWVYIFGDDWPASLSGWPDTRYSLDELCLGSVSDCSGMWQNTPEGLRAARTLELTGTYQIAVTFDQSDPGDTNVFIDQIELVNCDGCIPPLGGWPTCDTVDDPDFDTGFPWTLSGGASITGSVLSLAYTGAYAQQDFAILAQTYTVTVRARRTSSETTDGLEVKLCRDLACANSYFLGLTDEWETKETYIKPATLGDGYLKITAEGTYEVDYICLGAAEEEPVCSPSTTIFDLNSGVNLDWSILDWSKMYGFSQGWQGVDYFGDPDTGVAKARWGEVQTGNLLNPDIAAQGLLNSYQASDSVAAVVYDYAVIPYTMTIDTLFIDGTTPWLEVWIDDGSGWSELTDENSRLNLIDGTTVSLGYVVGLNINLSFIGINLSEEVIKSQLVFSFDGEHAIHKPIKIGLAIHDDVSPTPLFAHPFVGFDRIEIYGCPTGAPVTAGNCVVADPDLDEYNGEPSRYYWQGDFTADGARGGAIVGPGTVIYQNILPPVAGRYDLQIEYDVDDAVGGCSFDVRFYDYSSTDLFSSQTVNCETGPGHVTIVPVRLPQSPVELNFRGIAGTILLDRVCLTSELSGMRCLNKNPLFTDGVEGYTGDLHPGGGYSTLFQGGRMSAIEVDYEQAEPPYMLDLTVSPAISGTTSTLVVDLEDLYQQAQNQVVTITDQAAITVPLPTGVAEYFYWGPTVQAETGGLRIYEYCLTHTTAVSLPVTDPTQIFTCTTVSNAHFDEGLADWEYNNVSGQYRGIASFGYGASISQTLGEVGSGDAMVRWLGRSWNGPITATLQVNDQTITRTFGSEGIFFEDDATITGTTTITVSTTKSGLELDFICLYLGDSAPYLPPGDDGGIEIPPGSKLATCEKPPMGVLPDSVDDWVQTMWPWGGTMTNYEVMMAYNTHWVRYIGCTLESYVTWVKEDFWGWSTPFGISGNGGLQQLLKKIIGLLTLQALLQAIDTVITTLQAIEQTVKEIAEIAEKIGTIVVGIVTVVAIVLSVLWMVAAFIFTLFAKLMYALANPCSDVTLGTNNYAILAGWQFTQDAIAATPLKYLTLIAANVLIFKFFNWVASLFK